MLITSCSVFVQLCFSVSSLLQRVGLLINFKRSWVPLVISCNTKSRPPTRSTFWSISINLLLQFLEWRVKIKHFARVDYKIMYMTSSYHSTFSFPRKPIIMMSLFSCNDTRNFKFHWLFDWTTTRVISGKSRKFWIEVLQKEGFLFRIGIIDRNHVIFSLNFIVDAGQFPFCLNIFNRVKFHLN